MPDFTGTTGNDTLTGTSDDDNIYGLGGVDTIDAGDGNDLVVIRAQINPPPNPNSYGTISGGLGIDTLRIDRMYGPTPAQGPFGAYSFHQAPLFESATTIISGFERLQFGSQAGDILTVSLRFGGAAGQINQIGPGLAANAELIGGAGQDGLNLSYSASVAGGVVTAPSFTYLNWDTVSRAYLGGDRVFISISGMNGVTINGSAHVGVQALYGGSGNDTINGSNDMDLIYGGNGGSDFLYGNGGDDTLLVTNGYVYSSGTPGPETTYTGAGTLFDGGSGVDFLMLGGNVNFQGTLQNIEGLYLQPGYVNLNNVIVNGILIQFASQYNTVATFSRATFAQLPSNLLIDGYGDVVINLANGGDSIDASQIFFDIDSLVRFSFYGGDGNDTITGALVSNYFYGGAGNDIFYGNDEGDEFYLDGGTDAAYGGAGYDYFYLSGGINASIVNGGADFDTLQVNDNATLTGQLTGIELISIAGGSTLNIGASNLMNGLSPSGTIYAQSFGATLGVGLTSGETSFYGINYTFSGSTMQLAIVGNSLNNVLAGAINTFNYIDGGNGADQIKGFSLSDRLIGGAGTDKIVGNGGSDLLTGGADNDVFKFRNVGDSGLGGAADRITDFVSGSDRLNFVKLDADAALAGDQAFAFNGTGTFVANGLGQIRYQDSGGDLLVLVDVNGDGNADMSLILQGLAGQTLTSGDFVL